MAARHLGFEDVTEAKQSDFEKFTAVKDLVSAFAALLLPRCCQTLFADHHPPVHARGKQRCLASVALALQMQYVHECMPAVHCHQTQQPLHSQSVLAHL